MSMSLPTGLSLATINSPPTPSQWNDAELAVATVLGLPTTTWQAGAVERTVFAVVANVQAQADISASIAIQGAFLDFAASGTVTYTVEHTYDDPNAVSQQGIVPSPYQYSLEANSFVPPVPWPNNNLLNMTTNGESQYVAHPVMAHRLTVTAGTGKATMQSIQSGIGDP